MLSHNCSKYLFCSFISIPLFIGNTVGNCCIVVGYIFHSIYFLSFSSLFPVLNIFNIIFSSSEIFTQLDVVYWWVIQRCPSFLFAMFLDSIISLWILKKDNSISLLSLFPCSYMMPAHLHENHNTYICWLVLFFQLETS